MALLYRNTDKDWQQIGETEPFWGVLTAPEFRSDALTAKSLESFYASGRGYIGWLEKQMERYCPGPFRSKQALDFGCGVGRVTHAMTAMSDHVVGVDVAPAMLAKARERDSDRIQFQNGLTDETFDWLHSYIVFQHIPPSRGMAILRDLLGRLLPDGRVTLHFTVARSDFHRGGTVLARLRQWYEKRIRPANHVSMFDYDLGGLMQTFYNAGINQMTLLPTDHGGHFGVFIIGRNGAKSDVI